MAMKEKRIVFTGGGTAGHVIVNLALIPHFEKAGWEIHYIGSKDGIERELIEELPHVTYHAISTGKLRRYMSIENMKDPFKVLKGITDAWRIIGKVKPDIIFSKGGFVSVPVVVAGRMRRVPTIIHESDMTPGLANKLATKFAEKIVTTFPETQNYLPQQKAVHVGAVIREELFQGDEAVAYELTNLNKKKPIILIMGGSSGSANVNKVVRTNLPKLLTKYQIIHICGAGNVDKSIDEAGYVQFEYVNEQLKDVLSIADYVVSRAGANAIYEFLALNIPMLLIPLPLSASRGDQIDNAKSFVKNGYAHMLMEEDITEDAFERAIERLVSDESALRENMKKEDMQVARDEVIHLIKSMAK